MRLVEICLLCFSAISTVHGRLTRGPTLSPATPPSFLTKAPSFAPSEKPTLSPVNPTPSPSISPTVNPTSAPIISPTSVPSTQPSLQPSAVPTQPTSKPSSLPTTATPRPSAEPTSQPSQQPTMTPTSSEPTSQPSAVPSFTFKPTPSPTTAIPTAAPTTMPPSFSPTPSPSFLPTAVPSEYPTFSPTPVPSFVPTTAPSAFPTSFPTSFPTVPIRTAAVFELTETIENVDANDVLADEEVAVTIEASILEVLTALSERNVEVISVSDTTVAFIAAAAFLSKPSQTVPNSSIGAKAYYSRRLQTDQVTTVSELTVIVEELGYADADEAETAFREALEAALDSGEFDAILNELAAELGADSLLTASISSVTISLVDVSVIRSAAPTQRPTNRPGSSSSSSGSDSNSSLIAGVPLYGEALLIVGLILIVAILVGLVIYYYGCCASSKSNGKDGSSTKRDGVDDNTSGADSSDLEGGNGSHRQPTQGVGLYGCCQSNRNKKKEKELQQYRAALNRQQKYNYTSDTGHPLVAGTTTQLPQQQQKQIAESDQSKSRNSSALMRLLNPPYLKARMDSKRRFSKYLEGDSPMRHLGGDADTVEMRCILAVASDVNDRSDELPDAAWNFGCLDFETFHYTPQGLAESEVHVAIDEIAATERVEINDTAADSIPVDSTSTTQQQLLQDSTQKKKRGSIVDILRTGWNWKSKVDSKRRFSKYLSKSEVDQSKGGMIELQADVGMVTTGSISMQQSSSTRFESQELSNAGALLFAAVEFADKSDAKADTTALTMTSADGGESSASSTALPPPPPAPSADEGGGGVLDAMFQSFVPQQLLSMRRDTVDPIDPGATLSATDHTGLAHDTTAQGAMVVDESDYNQQHDRVNAEESSAAVAPTHIAGTESKNEKSRMMTVLSASATVETSSKKQSFASMNAIDDNQDQLTLHSSVNLDEIQFEAGHRATKQVPISGAAAEKGLQDGVVDDSTPPPPPIESSPSRFSLSKRSPSLMDSMLRAVGFCPSIDSTESSDSDNPPATTDVVTPPREEEHPQTADNTSDNLSRDGSYFSDQFDDFHSDSDDSNAGEAVGNTILRGNGSGSDPSDEASSALPDDVSYLSDQFDNLPATADGRDNIGSLEDRLNALAAHNSSSPTVVTKPATATAAREASPTRRSRASSDAGATPAIVGILKTSRSASVSSSPLSSPSVTPRRRVSDRIRFAPTTKGDADAVSVDSAGKSSEVDTDDDRTPARIIKRNATPTAGIKSDTSDLSRSASFHKPKSSHSLSSLFGLVSDTGGRKEKQKVVLDSEDPSSSDFSAQEDAPIH